MITPLIQFFLLFNQLKNTLRPFMEDESLNGILIQLEALNQSLGTLSASDLQRALVAFITYLHETAPKPEVDSRYIVEGNPPDPAFWKVKKVAWDYLGIGKTTLEERVATGKLKAYHLKGAETQKQPRVFFRMSDLADYRKDDSRKKGKTR